MISSIYTIILLSYIGVYEAQPFEVYENLAEKLREYNPSIEKPGRSKSSSFYRRLEEELTIGIKTLSRPVTLKKM
jgi:hypothetical protein